MAAAFGVHFGSTSACLAVYKDGKTDVVANEAGDRVTPAIVAFTDHDKAVGLAAKQGIIRNAQNTVCNVKQTLGREFTDPAVQQITASSPVKIVEKDGKPAYEVEFQEKRATFTPVQIAELVYKNMREIAQSHGDGEIHDTVVTCPVDYNPQQRNALSQSAEAAGFHVLRVINEPTAAALAYDLGQKDIHEYCNVLVYRLGGTSCDCTVISVNCGMYRILANISRPDIGGSSFTDVLAEHFAGEFKRQWKSDVHENKRAVAKLKNAAENCKHVLSTMPTAQCSVESLHEGIDFQSSVSRARFESLVSSLLQQCLQPVEQVLTEAQLTKENIHKVIVCGGTTKIPALQRSLKDYFNEAEFLNSIVPDEVVALGAAKQAAILTGNEEESKLHEQENEVECLSKQILIKVLPSNSDQDKLQVLFPAFTPIPVRRQHVFDLSQEQTTFCVEIFEADDSINDRVLLGRVVMQEVPENGQITAVFHIRREGSLHVTCTEKTSGKLEDVLIEAQ